MPVSKRPVIPVIFSVDDNYAPYLGVCLMSLIHHASPKNYYDIWVLEQGLSPEHKNLLLKLRCSNVSIRFFSLKDVLTKVDAQLFYTDRLSITTYFRIFIPRLFKDYHKVIYLDSDLIVLEDIAHFYQEDLGDNMIGATQDMGMQFLVFHDKQEHTDWGKYLKNDLGISHATDYFCAGVLLLDLDKLRAFSFEDKCLAFLTRHRPRYEDQCMMNSVLRQKWKEVPLCWDVVWWVKTVEKASLKMPMEIYHKYVEAMKKPKIIHYCGVKKVWFCPDIPLGEIWWKYALQSPFASEIMTRKNQKLHAVKRKLLILKGQNLIYKILSFLMFKKGIFQVKKNRLKEDIRQLKRDFF